MIPVLFAGTIEIGKVSGWQIFQGVLRAIIRPIILHYQLTVAKLVRMKLLKQKDFLTFPKCFSIPIIFSNFDFNCSNLSSLRNLQEQVKKAFCYQELFWPFTVWINCSSDLKNFENSRPSASNFKSFSRSLEQFFLTVGQNNFGNKIPFVKD